MQTYYERLRNYRENVLKLNTKKEMAQYLNISERVYAMAENGTRPLSKNLLATLVAKTNLNEAYWLYGVEPTHINNSELSSTVNMLEQLLKAGDIKINQELSPAIKDLLLTALETDIKHLLFNRSKKE